MSEKQKEPSVWDEKDNVERSSRWTQRGNGARYAKGLIMQVLQGHYQNFGFHSDWITEPPREKNVALEIFNKKLPVSRWYVKS